MRSVLLTLTMLLAVSPASADDWKLLGSYVMGGKRICTYQQGDAGGTAVVEPDDKCPAEPKKN